MEFFLQQLMEGQNLAEQFLYLHNDMICAIRVWS